MPSDRFIISYELHHQPFTAEVEMIQENDMEEAFYRVWTQGTIYDIMHYMVGTDSYKSWKELSNDSSQPREDVADNLIQVIGRAIEQKLNNHSNSQ